MDEYYGDSCRVCLCTKTEDFESVFQDDNPEAELSVLGQMYQDFFNLAIVPNKMHPRYLCGYCSLQLKLIYKLKCKAYESHKQFLQTNVQLLDIKEESYIKVQNEASNKHTLESLEVDNIDCTNQGNDVNESIISDHLSNDEEEQYEEIENDSNEEFEEIQYLDPEYQSLEVVQLGITALDGKKKNSKSANYPCQNCDEIFEKKSHLLLHRRQKHRRQEFHCSYCQKVLFSRESLNVHLNIHNGLPAYQCELCDKTFNQKAHYVYHMLGHRNERKFGCHLCEKKFLNKSDLGVHLRVHYDERRYECDVCHRRFRAYTHMTNHRYSHFEKRLECKYCFQKYTSPNTLKTHIKSVHLLECPFTCDLCNKKFKRKHHLNAHQKVHLKKDVGKLEQSNK